MSFNKLTGRLSKVVAAACLMGAFGSATASAAPVPATLSSSGYLREIGNGTNLRWYADGVLAGQCAANIQGAAYLYGSGSGINGTVTTCFGGGAPLWFHLTQTAYNDGGAYSLTWNAAFAGFPGYTVNNPTFSTPWANGSGSTPSTITFNNTVIGTSTNGHVISMTGVLNVTTTAGGLLTLS